MGSALKHRPQVPQDNHWRCEDYLSHTVEKETNTHSLNDRPCMPHSHSLKCQNKIVKKKKDKKKLYHILKQNYIKGLLQFNLQRYKYFYILKNLVAAIQTSICMEITGKKE